MWFYLYYLNKYTSFFYNERMYKFAAEGTRGMKSAKNKPQLVMTPW